LAASSCPCWPKREAQKKSKAQCPNPSPLRQATRVFSVRTADLFRSPGYGCLRPRCRTRWLSAALPWVRALSLALGTLHQDVHG
jgi:hypothetical protein